VEKLAMTLRVDGDGCPVLGQVLEAARDRPVAVYCDVNHCPGDERARWIIVDAGADSADLALVNDTVAGDIVITQDYGLAALALAKGARCLHVDGWRIDGRNIDGLLASRHQAAEFRRAGGRTRGPKKRNPQQNQVFCRALRAMLEDAKERHEH
jgi:uncharacterized protein YaiI (UPF0178 family)